MARSTVPLKHLHTLAQPRNTVQFQLHVQLSIAIKEKLALSNQPLEQSGGKRVVKQAINSTQFPRFSETKQVKVARLESILYTKVSLPPSSSVGLHPLGRADDVNPRSTLIFEEISPSAGVTIASYTFFQSESFASGSFVHSFRIKKRPARRRGGSEIQSSG